MPSSEQSRSPRGQTIHQRLSLLKPADDLAKKDLIGRACQNGPAPAPRFDNAHLRQLLNDLGEMIAREIIAGRNWRNLGVLVLLVSALAWIMAPSSRLTALALAAAGVLHLLHLAYAFLPVGALVMAVSAVVPAFATNAAGQHWWMAGCIAMMTMAVMTRATRGHTGHDLAGIAWIAGFAGFCLRYGPMLLNRRDGQPQGQNPLHAIRVH